MAEHDWYEKHKKDVAVALKKGRSAAKDAGVPCTLVKMKDGSALLCAHVSGSKAAALVKEARGAGGKVLSSGTLYKGDDGPTFAVADGSTAVKGLFAAAAAEAAGAPMNVIVVAVTPPGEAATPPPAPAAVPAVPLPGAPAPAALDGDKSRFTDLLRQVRPRFQQALAAAPPNKASLEKGMTLAVAAAKENDFGKGLKVLQALDGALQKASTPGASAPPPPPAPPPPAPPPPTPPPTAAIQAALAKMIPHVKNAAMANPARKTELLDPLKRCQDHLKNDQAAEAKAALFDLSRVLKDLNGAAPPPSPPPPPVGKAPTVEDEAEGREEEQEEAEAKEGVTAPESKEEAGEQEEEEEEEKSGTAPPPEDEEEEETTTVGVWVKARDKVVTQMQALQAALGKETQETGDPDFDLIADKGLAAITKRLQVGLHVALLEFDRASGDAKATARTKAQKVVGEFQTFLGSNGLIALAEENPWGVKVEIRSTLGAAFDQLSKTLNA